MSVIPSSKRNRFWCSLTNFPQSDIRRDVGRPPLKKNIATKPTMVRLTEDVRQRIEAIAGPKRMAEFIREAVEGELKRRERERAKKPD